jgi:hypothetical protein
MNKCPVCGVPAESRRSGGIDYERVSCARCGEFRISRSAVAIIGGLLKRKPNGRFAASHVIRRSQAPSNSTPLSIDSEQLKLFWEQPLPNPQRRADLMILALGDSDVPPGDYVTHRRARFCAEIGTEDDPGRSQLSGFGMIAARLVQQNLIEAARFVPPDGDVAFALTFDGWARYEQLRREVIHSRTAFMAMGYGNPLVDQAVSQCFVPAVKATGFDLFRLDDRPRPGLIDNRMRVEIIAAKFL